MALAGAAARRAPDVNELLTTVGKISEPWADNVMRGDTLVRRSFLDAAAMSDNWFEQVRVQCPPGRAVPTSCALRQRCDRCYAPRSRANAVSAG